MIKESLFYSKILLFGEYGIIQDAMGLSIPYNFKINGITFLRYNRAHTLAIIYDIPTLARSYLVVFVLFRNLG